MVGKALLALLLCLPVAAFAQGWPAVNSTTPPGIANASGCGNIVSFGGVGDGVTDNVAAFNAVKAVSRCIVFPAGKFRFNGALNYYLTQDKQSVTIKGQGQDVTELWFPNTMIGPALSIRMSGPGNGFHVQDLSMTTSQLNTETALYAENTMASPGYVVQSGFAGNDVTRVTFRPEMGYALSFGGTAITQGWAYGVYAVRVSVVNFVDDQFYGPSPPNGGYHTEGGTGGVGVYATSSDSTLAPVIFNFRGVNMTWLEKGILYGDNTQGYQIVGSNFTGCFSGIEVPRNVHNLAQLSVVGSQFNNTYNILIHSYVPQVSINDNLFFVTPYGSGIEQRASTFIMQVTGNSFTGVENLPNHDGTGIVITPDQGDAAPAVITGNTFYRLATGINFGPYVGGAIVSSNQFINNTTNVSNASGSPYNQITGGASNRASAFANVSGAVASGGSTRLTVNDTNFFFNGQIVLVGNVGGIGGIGAGQYLVTPITVVDATHMDLLNIAFSGTYTSGGNVTSLPP